MRLRSSPAPCSRLTAAARSGADVPQSRILLPSAAWKYASTRIRNPTMKSQATALYPFVPSGPDFTMSVDFFAELGFRTLWQHDGLAGLRFGGAYFILQEIDVPEWQKNQMITFEVDDLEA